MRNLMIAFLKDERGQTSTEYVLLLGVVAVIVMKFKAIAIPKIENLVNSALSPKWLDDLSNINKF